MESKKIIAVAVAIIIVAGAFFYFFVLNQDDSEKLIGTWVAESGLQMPSNATAYFTFYENGSVVRNVFYPTYVADPYWMDYWFEEGLMYMTANINYNPPGFFYQFSDNDDTLSLDAEGLNTAVFKKVGISPSDLWIKTYDGYKYIDEAVSIAVDSQGNVYVAGWTSNVSADPFYDWWIKKFDSDGVEDTVFWNKIIGNRNLSEQARGIAVDSVDNVYVVGSGFNIASDDSKNSYDDWWIKKFSSNGVEDSSWDKTFDYNYSLDRALSVAVDSSDNVYVLGYCWNPLSDDLQSLGNPPRMCIKKYDSNGVEDTTSWNKVFENGGFSGSISIGADNHLYAVWTGGDEDWSVTGVIKKFDLNGNLIWEKLYTSETSVFFNPTSITADSSGSSYIAGIRVSGFSNTGWWIKKFSSSGVEDILWDKSYATVGIVDQPKSILIDNDGFIIVSGYATNLSGATGKDWWVLKFKSNGELVDQRIYDGNKDDDAIWSAAINDQGYLYLSGFGSNLKGKTYLDWWIKKITI